MAKPNPETYSQNAGRTKGSPYVGKDRQWTRWGALKAERTSWDTHAKELASLLLPRSSRFTSSDRNRGGKRHNAIYDSTGLYCNRVLAAGMMAGMTSPARPWFKLGLNDKELMKSGPVKQWLADVTNLMLAIFNASNTYRALHTCYTELGCFGTHAIIVASDFENVIHCTPLTWGEYAIATDDRGVVNALYREFDMTVAAMVKKFGYDQCSTSTQNLYDRKAFDSWVTIVHAIEPRETYDSAKLDKLNMPYSSCYFELTGPKTKYLMEGGFKRFNVLAPRWDTSGGDIYGNSPGMEVLGDTKQLQHEQLRKAQGIDYQTKPPVVVPTAMKGQEIDTLPGGISYADSASPSGGVRAAFQIQLQLDHLLEDIQDVRGRIKQGFYADLFLMLASGDLNTMTATEVAERHEEKMLMLGPVLERLHNELLSPLIDITFDIMHEAGILPPPPPELSLANIDVEFVSVLAQAQKAVSTTATDRWLDLNMRLSQLKPGAADVVNEDEVSTRYGEMVGIDPKMINDATTIAATRKARAQAQAEAMKQAQLADAAKATSQLGKVATQGGASNAGADVMSMFSGYQSPIAESYG